MVDDSAIPAAGDTSSPATHDGSSTAFDDGLLAGSAALGKVSTICCTRDGSRAVTGHENGAVQLWNAETGELLGGALRRHIDVVLCVALSEDGKRAASGSQDKTMQVWNVKTGEQIGDALCGHCDGVVCVALSADEKRAASADSAPFPSADNATHATQPSRPMIDPGIIGRDGSRVGHRDRRINMRCTARAQVLGGMRCAVLSVALSADGTRVAFGSGDETVRVWTAGIGEPTGGALRRHGEHVECVALSTDGKRVASGARDKTLRLWDVGTGECLQADDDWIPGDLSRLRFLFREEDADSGQHREKSSVRFELSSVIYGSAGDSIVQFSQV